MACVCVAMKVIIDDNLIIFFPRILSDTLWARGRYNSSISCLPYFFSITIKNILVFGFGFFSWQWRPISFRWTIKTSNFPNSTLGWKSKHFFLFFLTFNESFVYFFLTLKTCQKSEMLTQRSSKVPQNTVNYFRKNFVFKGTTGEFKSCKHH